MVRSFPIIPHYKPNHAIRLGRCIDKLTAKAQKITIKLPWEIMTMFSDVLPTDDEEDEDDIEAHEASIQRLKVRSIAVGALLRIVGGWPRSHDYLVTGGIALSVLRRWTSCN